MVYISQIKYYQICLKPGNASAQSIFWLEKSIAFFVGKQSGFFIILLKISSLPGYSKEIQCSPLVFIRILKNILFCGSERKFVKKGGSK